MVKLIWIFISFVFKSSANFNDCYQTSMSKKFSAVIADGFGRFFVHLFDVDLKPVLLSERRAAHRTPEKKKWRLSHKKIN